MFTRPHTPQYCPDVLRRARFLLALALACPPASAQTPDPATPLPLPQEPCEQGRISYVFIDNASIFDTSDPDLDRRFGWAYRAANALHIRTREGVIRRELLFGVGSCYDPFLLEETERLLRSYDFLAEVDVFGAPQADGTWHVVVDTRDEWSTRVDVRVNTTDGLRLEGIKVSEDNLLGTGQSVGVFYYERDVTRDYGVSYATPQLLGTRWDVQGALGRTRAGTLVQQEVAYPFVGEVSRWAGRQSFRRDDQFFDYVAGDDARAKSAHVLVPLREQLFDLAVVRRVGERGSSALFGAALTYQQLSYPGPVQVAPEGRFDERLAAPDSLADQVLPQLHPLDNIRVMALLGHRNVWWVRRRGLDSMRGQEDVRLGAEALLSFGRALPALETDDDVYAMLGLYAGLEVGNFLVIGRGRGDARRDLTAGANEEEWQDVYLEADVLAYLRPSGLPRHTFFMQASTAGGWHTRVPFQLTLGGDYALRGYDRERFPAGRRLTVTLEDRFYIGWPLPDVLDVGGTVFADVGRAWAGDAPFGMNTGWQASAGLGLRGSFPAGSRSTYRIDVAWPVRDGVQLGDFRLSLSVGELRGLAPRDPDPQIVRSRTQNVGGNLMIFRN